MYLPLFARLDVVCGKIANLIQDSGQFGEFDLLRRKFRASFVNYENQDPTVQDPAAQDSAARDFCNDIVSLLSYASKLLPNSKAIDHIYKSTGDQAAVVIVECFCEIIYFELEELENSTLSDDKLCDLASMAREKMNIIDVTKNFGFNHLDRCSKELARCIDREAELTHSSEFDSEVKANRSYEDLAELRKCLNCFNNLPALARIWLPLTC